MIGVYKITNTVDGKVYVGSTTKDFGLRWNEHKSSLRRGKHPNLHLQRAWNIHGEGAFTFEIVETTDRNEVRSKEESWIKKFFGKNCYNATDKVSYLPAEVRCGSRQQSELERESSPSWWKNADDKLSKPEDQLVRNWLKRVHGVRISQYTLWQLTIEEAVKRLKSISPSLSKITQEDVEKAARRR